MTGTARILAMLVAAAFQALQQAYASVEERDC